MTEQERNELSALDEAIRSVTHDSSVKVDNYAKYGCWDGQTTVYTRDIAKALYELGYRKVAEPCKLTRTEQKQKEDKLVLSVKGANDWVSCWAEIAKALSTICDAAKKLSETEEIINQ